MKYDSIDPIEEGESQPLKGGCPDDTNDGMKKKQRSHFVLTLMVGLFVGAFFMGALSKTNKSSAGMATKLVGSTVTSLPAVPSKAEGDSCFTCKGSACAAFCKDPPENAPGTEWMAGKIGPVGVQGGSPDGQYNPNYWCEGGKDGNPTWGCFHVGTGHGSFCDWARAPLTQDQIELGYTGKAFSHTYRQGPWSECNRDGPRCWVAKAGTKQYLVAGVDQNSGNWPNTAIYDFESWKPDPTSHLYEDNNSPYAKIAKGNPLGGSLGQFTNVWTLGYVDCDTGKP